MTDDQPARYVMPAEAAAILNVNPKTIGRWAKEGRLPFITTLGGHRRFEEGALRELVAQNTVPASHPQQ